jgi:hypothetical protein
MSQTKTGKTKSVQVSDAGYARVMETARQLRLTQLGAASLLIEAATPDGIKRVVNRALGNMTTAQTEPVRGVVPATVGEGTPEKPGEVGAAGGGTSPGKTAPPTPTPPTRPAPRSGHVPG